MSLSQEIEALVKEAETILSSATSEQDLDSLKNQFIGKKGKLTSVLKGLAALSVEEKKTVGKQANEAQGRLESFVESKRTSLKESFYENKLGQEFFDSLQPLASKERGSLHPISQIQYEIEDIFTSMGFSVMDGPEVETDENNFGALNFTEDHPARDMQDTFYTEDGNLLRTHTSAIQVRALRKLKPPFRIIAPGRVFRYEEVDASHENTFYQVEGMVVGENISVAHLIYTMETLLSRVFRKEIKTRLRPGYFPFVEPGFELDINCLVCGGDGCSVCKHSGWLELLPCGLVHPNVLEAAGLDSKKWTGFAFGLGLDRLVMMRYGIHDIRYFQSGNLRFLRQF
ncbi:phenylalanine--tRNA ligase subunit alpha [Leptospira sp. 85282-16]|uniref:Phenylalanine--tRNA ligase alpha subunit n=1 Tax=Leptospira montravelensis TaxID=2484961 RepID=A0ABY2LM84_9LEPT|nr:MULTISPECIES: phenylalanine--tRNA ligase subunit alpha [Leptospira]MCT8333690.1 phenylalanine--tRNA ligase subunit alpha [Leptospira sp. 85282-16]TGK80107.1 phenylalanine--tRNA ligase subunit alpha [Leptospira montravelensis]TGL00277.1 phenylalanine--tRNA ligase subunit alpha [Leptospira montravelensis]